MTQNKNGELTKVAVDEKKLGSALYRRLVLRDEYAAAAGARIRARSAGDTALPAGCHELRDVAWLIIEIPEISRAFRERGGETEQDADLLDSLLMHTILRVEIQYRYCMPGKKLAQVSR